MKIRLGVALLPIVWLGCLATINAQSPKILTLKDAQALALQNQPRIGAAKARAGAAEQVPTELHAAKLPFVSAYSSAAGAETNVRIAAGGLNNPIILSRVSSGVAVSQMITDFGRTDNLIKSSKLKAQADEQLVNVIQDDVLLDVDQAYFTVLRADAVEKVAAETVKERQSVVDQITELTNNKLKSSLDLTFAKVNLSTAQLLLLSAQNNLKAAQAQLSLTLGGEDNDLYTLVDEPLPPPPGGDPTTLVSEAIKNRPEMLTFRLYRDSALSFAQAEHRLKRPSAGWVGAAGYTPFHVSALKNHYDAVGATLTIPIFSGHLFSARAAEADLKAKAADQDLQDLQTRIVRDVRVAWLDATTAFNQLDLTAQLVNRATESLDLAKTRYDLGLSSIVELNQAQLNLTEAQLGQARAKYEYQIKYAVLQHHIGALH
jgi:outer membrane protein